MNTKSFLNKSSSGKVSAAAFIAAHREWLTQGTLAAFTAPILARLDAGAVLPTPALGEIKQVVLDHQLAVDAAKGLVKAAGEPRTVKPYTATVYDERGCVCTRVTEEGDVRPLVQNFDAHHRAQEWADRRLDNEGPGAYALIVNNSTASQQRVERDDSIARLYGRRTPGPVTKGSPKSAPLSWGMKIKGDHFHFSKG